MHGRKMVSLHYAVSDTGFADDRNAGFGESSNVPIDGADTSREFLSNILRAGYPAPLHIDQDSNKSIDAFHRTSYSAVIWRLELQGWGRDRMPPLAVPP